MTTPASLLAAFRTLPPDEQTEALTDLLLERTPLAPMRAGEIEGRMWFAAYSLAWAVRTANLSARRTYVLQAARQLATLSALLDEGVAP